MGRLLAFFGIPACAAILAYSIVYIGVLWFGGEPPTWGRLLPAMIFGGLSLVVVLITLNAWSQDRHRGKPMGLWVLIPILLIGGAGAGGVWAFMHGQDRLETLEHRDRQNCESLLGDVAESEMEACLPVASECRRETAGNEVDGVLPQGFPANVDVSRAEDVDAIMCIYESL